MRSEESFQSLNITLHKRVKDLSFSILIIHDVLTFQEIGSPGGNRRTSDSGLSYHWNK